MTKQEELKIQMTLTLIDEAMKNIALRLEALEHHLSGQGMLPNEY